MIFQVLPATGCLRPFSTPALNGPIPALTPSAVGPRALRWPTQVVDAWTAADNDRAELAPANVFAGRRTVRAGLNARIKMAVGPKIDFNDMREGA